MRNRFVLASVLILAACGTAAAPPAAPRAPTTEPQPEAAPSPGAKVYAAECAGCHGKRGEGHGKAVALIGPGALPRIRDDEARGELRTGADLLRYVSTRMPLPKSRAGKLPRQQYLGVTEWLLEQNGRSVPEGGLTEANAASVPLGE
jgi:mono/diheme cytochrome c family protein